MTLRRTRFDGPLGVFFLSALWGAWIAYDSGAGLPLLRILLASLPRSSPRTSS